MKLWNEEELIIWVGDLETLRSCILLKFYNPDTKQWKEFEISNFKNEIEDFVQWYNKGNINFVCGFNWIDFDAVIIEYILNNHDCWIGLDGLIVSNRIYNYVQSHIDNRNYKIAPQFKEWQFTIPCIDVYTLLGLDNEARRSSLKKCEFQIDWFSVEEMPISHEKADINQEEIKITSDYCANDILATLELLKLSIGETNHPIYKGNNQLQLRYDIEEEFKIKCRNLSDIRLGDELMRKSYADAKGIKTKDLPRKGFFRKEVRLKNCVPKYVTFDTPILNKLFEELKKTSIKRGEKWEKKFKIGNTEYVQALGGLHSNNSNEIWKATEDFLIEDDDASSFYPKIIIENNYYPYHLGKELLTVYTKLYNRRIELKPLAKTDKKIKGITEALKLCCNSIFGKMGSMESWLYDPQAMYSVTLTGQFSLLMLIEKFEMNGIRVISANSDGLTTYFNKDKKELKDTLVKEWQDLTKFEIETVRFKELRYSTVNDYHSEKEDGEIKKKGDFITDFELWKNKSARIVPLALDAYFTKGENPIEFVKNHRNIYDFCIMARATGQLYLEEQWSTGSKVEIRKHKKLVRYYLSNTSNRQLFKRGIGTTGKNANISQNAANELGEIYTTYFNQFEDKPFEEYGVDVNQYIFRVLKMIAKIEHNKKDKNFIESLKPVSQGSLF